MVEMICKDDMFLVKGSFTMGLAGTYINETFEDGIITVEPTLDDILEELDDEDSPLFPYLNDKPRDGDSIAKGLAEYYNQKEREAAEHVKEINDNLLFHLFEDLYGSGSAVGGFPFWINDCIIKDCPDCGKPMICLAQLGEDVHGYEGNVVVEACRGCRVAAVLYQQT